MNLKNLRIHAGLTQVEIAKKIGLAPNHYSMIENGLRGLKPDKFKKLALALSVTLEDLINCFEKGDE